MTHSCMWLVLVCLRRNVCVSLVTFLAAVAALHCSAQLLSFKIVEFTIWNFMFLLLYIVHLKNNVIAVCV